MISQKINHETREYNYSESKIKLNVFNTARFTHKIKIYKTKIEINIMRLLCSGEFWN